MHTPGKSSTLLILQMLQLHYVDDHYEMLKKFFKEYKKDHLLPEEYWLISHGLMDENGKFLNYKSIIKIHNKDFSKWFITVIEIMFPDTEGESCSDK